LQVIDRSILDRTVRAIASSRAAGEPNFGDVDRALLRALDATGYAERRYFAVPKGFALVTRIERFSDDGQSAPDATRWLLSDPPRERFTVTDYLRALFSAAPGRFRVIVLVVTPATFSTSGEAPTRDAALGWLGSGLNALPEKVARLPWRPETQCTALICEFEKPPGGDAKLKLPGQVPPDRHLDRSRLLAALRSP
jgi:hypothetical protein